MGSLNGWKKFIFKNYYLHTPSVVVVVVKKVRNYHGPNMAVKERKNPSIQRF
jgi:hypothetical protein